MGIVFGRLTGRGGADGSCFLADYEEGFAMRRKALFAGLLAAAAVFGVATLAFGSGNEVTHPQTLRILQKGNTQQTFLPLNTQKDNLVGDEFVATGNVVRWQGTISQSNHKIGHLHAVCFAVDRPGITAECSTTTFLPGGDITSYGPIRFVAHARTTAAITGGTGTYRNARGEVTFVNTSPNTEGLIYHIEP
jgi:hypothetical protein